MLKVKNTSLGKNAMNQFAKSTMQVHQKKWKLLQSLKLFGRSISKRNLKYTTFVGDGDSSSYGRVRDAMFQKYGDEYIVTKEECVGHVQKRLGTALRKYKADKKGKKLSDGKGVGGRGRFTDKIMDRQNHGQNAKLLWKSYSGEQG
jgi:hypothetical protein